MGDPQLASFISLSLVLKYKGGCRDSPPPPPPPLSTVVCTGYMTHLLKSTASGVLAPRLDGQEVRLMRS